MIRPTRFDAAEYLDSEDRQVAYIATALETGDADFVRDALGIVARAVIGAKVVALRRWRSGA